MSKGKTAFDRVWAIKEAEGYQYGEDALEQVRFGWDLYHEYGVLWPYDDAPFTALQVRELLEENAKLRAKAEDQEKAIAIWSTTVAECMDSITDLQVKVDDLQYKLDEPCPTS